LTDEDLKKIPSQKYPTTRTGVEYNQEFSAVELLKYNRNLKFKSIQKIQKIDSIEDIFKRNIDDPIRIYVELPLDKSIDKKLLKLIQSGTTSVSGGFYSSKSRKVMDLQSREEGENKFKIYGKRFEDDQFSHWRRDSVE